MGVKIQLAEPFPVHLAKRGRRIGARSGYIREVVDGGGVDARPRGERIVAEIAVIQSTTPGT